MTRVPLSLLDLARITEGGSPRQSLMNARDIAAHAESLGFQRYLVAEHHNMVGIASAAVSVVLAHVGAGTSSIRIGSAGIMLPNHAPYVIAEQFGTLGQLFPGRVDLGLGRAPGTDGATLIRALRRAPDAGDRFPQDVIELMSYFDPDTGGSRIRAVPAPGTEMGFILLGSSHFGALLAAELGLPYAFASHFAPDALFEALHLYRSNFKPSPRLQKPHAMVAVNVSCAETEAEARQLFTTPQQGFLGLIRNARGLGQPPVPDMAEIWTPGEEAQVMRMLACHAVGTPDQVCARLDALVTETEADELILITDMHDHECRKRSLALTAGAWAA